MKHSLCCAFCTRLARTTYGIQQSLVSSYLCFDDFLAVDSELVGVTKDRVLCADNKIIDVAASLKLVFRAKIDYTPLAKHQLVVEKRLKKHTNQNANEL